MHPTAKKTFEMFQKILFH